MKVGDLVKVESEEGQLRPPWYGMMGVIVGVVDQPIPAGAKPATVEERRLLGPWCRLYSVIVTDPRCPMGMKPLQIRENYLRLLSKEKSPRLQKNNTVTESNEVE